MCVSIDMRQTNIYEKWEREREGADRVTWSSFSITISSNVLHTPPDVPNIHPKINPKDQQYQQQQVHYDDHSWLV